MSQSFAQRHAAWKPQIYITEPFAPDFEIRGTTLLIDVLRFSGFIACLGHPKGLSEVIVTENFGAMDAIQPYFPGYLRMGEKFAQNVEGLTLRNSPSKAMDPAVNLWGKSALMTSSAGAIGLLRALERNVGPVIVGSFFNLNAVLIYLRFYKPSALTLLACGNNAQTRAIEDYLCAEYIKSMLLEETPVLSIAEIKAHCTSDADCSRFFDAEQSDVYPPNDFHISFEAHSAAIPEAKLFEIDGHKLARIKYLGA